MADHSDAAGATAGNLTKMRSQQPGPGPRLFIFIPLIRPIHTWLLRGSDGGIRVAQVGTAGGPGDLPTPITRRLHGRRFEHPTGTVRPSLRGAELFERA